MKDLSKILERFRKDCEKLEIEGANECHTIEEIIDLCAKSITIIGGAKVVALFKKYAIHNPEYVQENMSIFYDLIADKVQEQEEKALAKAGLSEEEIERNRIMQELGENRIIGYARVSTREQNLDRQLKALKDAGCQAIFQEKKSGKDTNRIEFKAMMKQLKKGDTVVVSELTRLARSTTDLFNIMSEFEAKGVSVKSIKEAWLDTSSAHGKLMFTIMSGMAQFERELMLERQQEGIAVAKEKGVKFGVKLSEKADLDLAVAMVKEGKYTMTQIANMCHISRTTLWRTCKKIGIQ